MIGYCVKCKAKIEMVDPKPVIKKNFKPATQGICPTCGTRVYVIGRTL